MHCGRVLKKGGPPGQAPRKGMAAKWIALCGIFSWLLMINAQRPAPGLALMPSQTTLSVVPDLVFAGAQVVLVASVGPNGPDGLPPRGVVVFRLGDAAPQVSIPLDSQGVAATTHVYGAPGLISTAGAVFFPADGSLLAPSRRDNFTITVLPLPPQTFPSAVTIIADSGGGFLAGAQANFTAAVSNRNSASKVAPPGGGQITFRSGMTQTRAATTAFPSAYAAVSEPTSANPTPSPGSHYIFAVWNPPGGGIPFTPSASNVMLQTVSNPVADTYITEAKYQRLDGRKVLLSARVNGPGNPPSQTSTNETTPAGTVAFAFPSGESVTGQVHLGLAQATYDYAPCGSYQVTATFVPFAVDLRPSSTSVPMNITCSR
eukprot:jgi/Botrbrau1/14905/Bobra.0018s0010.1